MFHKYKLSFLVEAVVGKYGNVWPEEDSVSEESFWASDEITFCNLEQEICLSAGAAVSLLCLFSHVRE